jgi:hypothetical protein
MSRGPSRGLVDFHLYIMSFLSILSGRLRWIPLGMLVHIRTHAKSEGPIRGDLDMDSLGLAWLTPSQGKR